MAKVSLVKLLSDGWMPLDLTDKSTLVQVMAWCRQATCHYLSQCWHRSMSPCSVIRPQWVNTLAPWRYDTKWVIFKCLSMISRYASSPSCECQGTTLICQQWFRCHQTTSHYLSQCWTRSKFILISQGTMNWMKITVVLSTVLKITWVLQPEVAIFVA